jgi:polysaccharide export outer membrane protein
MKEPPGDGRLRFNNNTGNRLMSNFLNRVALLVALLVAGCAGDGGVVAQAPVGASQAGSDGGTQYLIGPGDALQVFVWDHVDLTTNVQVRPDGRISTPLVEDLPAAGKTPTELGRDIAAALGEYVRNPVVTVIVQGFVGETGQQIRVVGQAVQPMALQYREGMTVLDVMISVGGLSELAAGNRARIVRTVNGQQTETRVRLSDLLNDGDIEHNVRVLPGDVIIIPRSAF